MSLISNWLGNPSSVFRINIAGITAVGLQYTLGMFGM